MEIKSGEQAMFKNQKQEWINGEFVTTVLNSYVYRIDDDIFISKEYKKIEPKNAKNTYHLAFYTDKSEIYSNGIDVMAYNMAEALTIFTEKFAKIEPIYIIKK